MHWTVKFVAFRPLFEITPRSSCGDGSIPPLDEPPRVLCNIFVDIALVPNQASKICNIGELA
jgi:hypothetical protein